MEKQLFIDKNKCCGCGVCANICKLGAIQMNEDKDGFLYPSIDAEKCVNCGMCGKHCPIVAHEAIEIQQHHVACYGGYLKDSEELRQSASGGAATALAKAILNEGGVVFGAEYCEGYRKAKTVKIDSIAELTRIKDSKYMQSDKGTIYEEVKDELEHGNSVLFTGTPCEIGAVKTFLGKDYDNLYTCELICHGPTTYKVAEKYINALEKKHKSKLSKKSEKSKELGRKVPHIKLEFENGKTEEQELYKSDYGVAFSVMLRESCHQCSYKGDGKVADITVGDFWGYDENDSHWNSDGISAIIVHTERGKHLLQMLSDMELFTTSYDAILKNNLNLERNEPYNRAAGLFKKGVQSIGLSKTVFLYNKYQKVIGYIKKATRGR